MGVDVTQVAEMVVNDGYSALFESYEAVGAVFPLLCEVRPVTEAGSPYYGDKGSSVEGLARFKERPDGASMEDSTINTAYTWQAGIKQFSRQMTIPKRLLLANNAMPVIKDKIVQASRQWGEIAAIQKDDYVADMFQKGTLTAGSTEFFDNSFPGNVDPNKGFIYDGLPFFDTAHTLAGSTSTLANHTVSGALTQSNLESHMTTMTSTNAVNERGERVIIRPNLLIVPPGLEYTARVILGTDKKTGSEHNDINPIATQSSGVQLIVWRALDDAASASSWWIGQGGRGLRAYDSGAPVLTTREKENGDVIIQAEYHFGATVTNWRYWYCSHKAAS